MPAVRASASGDPLTNTLAAVVTVLLLSGAVLFCVYPVYPAFGTLCDVLVDANTPSPILSLLPDEWARRYASRGSAVVHIDVVVHGNTPGDSYYIETPCFGSKLYAALELPDAAAVSKNTLADLSSLQTPVYGEDRSIEANLIARVDTFGGGCFGPPMTLTVLAMETRGARTVVNRHVASARP
jgi:hypothetical protein